jgi:hypothetical protein
MMQNIQESAASSCVERFDQYRFDLARRAPITMEDFGVSHSDEEALFTKKIFEEVMEKFSHRAKK